jgi:hypothetical protein
MKVGAKARALGDTVNIQDLQGNESTLDAQWVELQKQLASDRNEATVIETSLDKDIRNLNTQLTGLQKIIQQSAPKGNGPPPVTGQSTTIYFNSTVQFTVTAGVSGGPSWRLRNFTGQIPGVAWEEEGERQRQWRKWE